MSCGARCCPTHLGHRHRDRCLSCARLACQQHRPPRYLPCFDHLQDDARCLRMFWGVGGSTFYASANRHLGTAFWVQDNLLQGLVPRRCERQTSFAASGCNRISYDHVHHQDRLHWVPPPASIATLMLRAGTLLPCEQQSDRPFPARRSAHPAHRRGRGRGCESVRRCAPRASSH